MSTDYKKPFTLREGTHKRNRINKPITEKSFPIEEKSIASGNEKKALTMSRFTHERGAHPSTNKPRGSREGEGEVKYSKSGSLLESYQRVLSSTRVREGLDSNHRPIKELINALVDIEGDLEWWSGDDEKYIDEYMTLRTVIDDLRDKTGEYR